ncbi:MAG: DUF4384 domain-containing protein [Trueperaceae bacterium]
MRHTRFSRPLTWALGALLVLALSACTVTIRSGESVGSDLPRSANPVIERFEVQGGEGANYRIGQRVRFQIRTRVEGHVTLTSMAPDGTVRVFARNLHVPARRTVVLDGREQGLSFTVGEMRGWHDVRASFTPSRTDVSRVTFRGRSGNASWTAAIRLDLAPFDVRDVAEARFFVR